MGDTSAHIIAAFLHHERKNDEVVMLTSVIAPPDYFIILTHSPPILAFLAKASLLLSAWFYRKPCILAVCTCRTQDNYKPHHIKYHNETTLHA